MRNSKLKMFNRLYSLTFLLLTVIYTIVYRETSYDSIDMNLLNFFKNISYGFIGIHTMLFILSMIIKKLTLQRIITYFNIAFLLLSDFTFRMFLIFLAHPDYLLFTLVFLIQKILAVTLFYTNSLDFFEGFCIYLTVACSSYAIYAGVIEPRYHYFFAINFCLLMMITFMSYFYILEKKNSFHNDQINNATIKWNKSILENINSGFISITNRKWNWANKSSLSLFEKIKASSEILERPTRPVNSNEEERIITNNKRDIPNIEQMNLEINDLFDDIQYEKEIDQENQKTDYQTAIQFIKNNFSADNDGENFIFLGNKIFNISYPNNKQFSNLYYEIYGRFCNQMKINEEEEEEEEEKFEFILNDMTKTKMAEEMKNKSLFLSKVAHEFKNPLICISELIDQVCENLNKNYKISNSDSFISYEDNPPTNLKVMENLTQIKSMCEYLLVLVKDLDFFSFKYIGSSNKIKLEKGKVQLDKIINYCNNVTNVLLEKYQKEKNIKFKVECKEDLLHKEIFTDEVRLKQLLINLLSNSVKYTYNGTITFKIQEENEKIVFDVIDTGIGLSDQNKEKLKDNLCHNREISANSSGLGFSIIKELLELFQSKLNFESNVNQGTRFFFSLDKIKANIIESIDSAIDQINISNPFSQVTVVKSFKGFKDDNLKLQIENIKKTSNFSTSQIIKKNKPKSDDEVEILKLEPNTDYYLVVDDEKTTRKSTIRMLNNYLISNDQGNRNQTIIESVDGIQCLNYFYESIKKGIIFSFIISDETMTFMNGSSCAKIISDITKSKGLAHVPFSIISAYENLGFKTEDGVDKIYTKPLTINNIVDLFGMITFLKK